MNIAEMVSESSTKRDLTREYLLYLKVEKGLAKNSIDSYERDLGKLSAWVEKNGLDLIAITRRDLREWLIDLGHTKLSANSKLRLISSLRGFYKFLMIDGHIKANPAENLDTPQKGSYLPRFLNQAEVESLLA
ncbi:MAG: site-specific integrase, partial [Pyrinomonadaceae bacterium]